MRVFIKFLNQKIKMKNHLPTNNLQDKTVVITGSSGQIGYATALRLAQAGARIIGLVHRNIDHANELFSKLPNQHLNHLIIQASIIDSDSLKNAVNQIDKCDILVNAAGTLNPIPPKEIDKLTDEIFDEMLAVNLRGVFSTIREFVPLLQTSDEGLIINISSQSGQRASNSCVAYAASKAGLDLMTRTLALSLAPKIRVIGIAPGYLETATSKVTRLQSNEVLAESSPLKRIASGDDVAAAVEAYATLIKYATGITVLLDGGRLL